MQKPYRHGIQAMYDLGNDQHRYCPPFQRALDVFRCCECPLLNDISSDRLAVEVHGPTVEKGWLACRLLLAQRVRDSIQADGF